MWRKGLARLLRVIFRSLKISSSILYLIKICLFPPSFFFTAYWPCSNMPCSSPMFSKCSIIACSTSISWWGHWSRCHYFHLIGRETETQRTSLTVPESQDGLGQKPRSSDAHHMLFPLYCMAIKKNLKTGYDQPPFFHFRSCMLKS